MRPVETDDLTITFDARSCIHARRCVLGLPNVFKPGTKGGWILADQAATDDLIRVIEACPSGALAYTRRSGPAEAAPPVNTARLWENGPVELHGEIVIGAETRTRATLCRCGQSANKPFCDNSHIAAGFTATSEPPGNDAAPVLETRDGPLTVTVIPNGPVKVSGPVEVLAGSGRQVDATTSLFLCRCGASSKKPYCDGTHKKIGFQAE